MTTLLIVKPFLTLRPKYGAFYFRQNAKRAARAARGRYTGLSKVSLSFEKGTITWAQRGSFLRFPPRPIGFVLTTKALF